MRKIGIGLTAALLIAAVAAPATASKPLPNQDPPIEYGHKISICHATSSAATHQFWEVITVDVASSGGNGINRVLGHVRHTDPDYDKKNGRLDLIPAFNYGGHVFDGATDPGSAEDWAAFVEATGETPACAGGVIGGEGDEEGQQET